MYLKDLSSVSPQVTYTEEFINGDYIIYSKNILSVIEPSYSEIIPASLFSFLAIAAPKATLIP